MKRYRPVLPVVCLLLALLTGLAGARSGAKGASKAADPWRVLNGYNLFSVAWSPKGDYIAFVATVAGNYADDFGNIWVMSVPKPNQASQLRQLAHLTGKQGIPVALFWLDDSRVGWAASFYPKKSGQDYTFLQMGLCDSKPRPLVSQNFSGIQTRAAAGRYGGPEDVYYDPDSRTLIFSGGLERGGAYVRILPLSTKKVRTLSVPGVDEASPITLCGSLRNPQKPEFYISAIVNGSNRELRIWLSRSFSLSQDKVLMTSKKEWLFFPRLSPDGKMLACLSYQTEILLYDLKSKKRRTVATIPSGWDSIQPAHGCPFSWSPDGKMIAYADGSRIKIVRVEK